MNAAVQLETAACTEELSFPEASKHQPKKKKKEPNPKPFGYGLELCFQKTQWDWEKPKQTKNRTSSLLPWDQLQILLLAAGNTPPSHNFSNITEIKSRPIC